MISLKKCTYVLVVLLAAVGCLDTLSAQTAQLTANPGQIVFNVQPGQTATPTTFRLTTNNSVPVQFSIQAATQSGGGWLVFSPASGNTPVDVFVTASSGGLTPGMYQGVLNVTAPGVSNSPLAVPVTLNVGSQLTASPSTLSFAYQTGSPAPPAAQTLAVNSTTSTATPYSVQAQTTGGGSWLLVNPAAGTTPGNVSVSVNPSGLAPGTYNGSVRFTSTTAGTSTFDVPVTLTISGNPTLSVTPGSVNFAYQVGTTAPGAQTLTFSTTGTAIPFTLTPSVNSGPNWIVLNSFSGQASQNQPQQITVNANVAGLLPGSYSGRIMVGAPGAATPNFDIPVNLFVSANPLMILGNAPQPFNYQMGGTAPASQTVQVTSSSTPISFAVTATTAGSNWLTITPNTGITPQTLTLTVDPNGLAPGTYEGTVSVSSSGAGNSPQTFPVKLTVSATTLLNASTTGLTFNYQTTSLTQPSTQIFRVTSTGAPLNYTVTATPAACSGVSNWLTVAPTTGTTPGDITVAVTPTGITPQVSCTGTISISAPGASNTATVPVTFNVSSNPLLNLAPNSLEFTAPAGTSTFLASKPISLTSTDGVTPIPFTYNVSTSNGGPWLFVAAAGANNTPSNISITVNPSGLQVGTYRGTVTITSPNLPAAQNIPVILTVTSNVNLAAAPASVTLTAPANASAPVTQNVQITSSGTGALSYTASATVLQGPNWLSVSPVSGNTPATLTISANVTGLTQGTYNGQVTVVAPGAANSPITIPVTLTVGPPTSIGVGTSTATFTYQLGGTAPPSQTVNVTSTGGPVNFTAETASTSCGGFLTVSPTSGTTPATLTIAVNTTGLTAGACNGTVTIKSPGMQSQVINVVLNVSAAPAPVITAVVNGASWAPGPIAPGEIVTIGGTNIGPATLTNYILNANNTFATTVADTTVFFDNVAAPIIYVSSTQASVVVPFEIAGRATTNITVRRGGVTSAALNVRVVDFAPGIFTSNSQGFGQGAILNQNFSVNGPTAPAAKGQVIQIYLTGAGLMNTNPATGSVLGSNPLPSLTTDNVAVRIGSQTVTDANITYHGGAPGAIAGLYQINAVVPQTVGSGPQFVEISIGGVPAQGNVTVYVQ